MTETSLLLGTLLSQMAVGCFATGYALRLIGNQAGERSLAAPLVALLVGLAGVFALFAHLGAPQDVLNAINNPGTSWLSREALCYGGFLLLALLYLPTLKGGMDAMSAGAKMLGALASLLGLGLVLVAGMIYMVPGVPAWDTAATPISFLLSALLMGVPLGVWLSGWRVGTTPALLTAMLAFAALCVSLVHVSSLLAGSEAQAASGYLMGESGMFKVRIALLLATVAYGLFAALKGSRAGRAVDTGKFGLLFCVLAVSEFLGRCLFFDTIVRM